MKIDLAPTRRELFREMAPSGTLEKMTPEERQRVGREVPASARNCRALL
jgi:hypothetical protein